MKLPVQETFQQTIQGEGYWAGLPVDFIRLAGCPVGCYYCDQGYANGNQVAGDRREVSELLAELTTPNVVISGGEPYIQPRLNTLIDALIDSGRKVHIETSGSFWQEVSPLVWVTLSPKQHLSKYPVDDRFWERADEVKIVIETGNELEFYQDKIINGSIVYLQPEWNQQDHTIPLTLEILKSQPTYRLSLQIHKIINVL